MKHSTTSSTTSPAPPPSGAHMSVAGGVHKAIELANGFEMTAVQIFTKNANQWRCKPLEDDGCQHYLRLSAASPISHHFAHASYLINLASADDVLWTRSVEATIVELQRAEQLQLAGVVLHPGAAVKQSREAGVDRVRRALAMISEQTHGLHTSLVIENTAGQGSTLGSCVAELCDMLSDSDPQRLGLCIDTCHAHAAGYDLTSTGDRSRLVDEMGCRDLLPRIRLLHVNDSLKPAGSRVDRHAHLGDGTIGNDSLAAVLNQPAFRSLPMILETPKGLDATGEDWDAVNLRRLRSWF